MFYSTMLFEIRLTIVRYGRRVQPVAPCGRAGLPPKISHLRTKLSQKAKQQLKFPLRASSMLSGIEDAPWQPLSLRVLMHEMPSVSRMREIRTSGLMRGEGLKKNSPSSTRPPLREVFFRLSVHAVFCKSHHPLLPYEARILD